jgi:hypothetical protein
MSERLRSALRTKSELERQQYYQHRNAKATEAHRKKRHEQFAALGIDMKSIKSLYGKGKSRTDTQKVALSN